ncbi:hypothetical protein M2222_005073 [Bradyrhizobium elkanii]|jgi:hypothetical protein|nr:hypothetical protein [Bradyrhizobium elkanii]MCS3562751.1 hypothetical protein [Bradyrhizobium elkanii]MCW2147412.1 hypothetical protein [Bradyrhizobium elkanii]MCW2353505.1 hypothetical protein [Bradyrhizobium elkanii]MCW2371139.1 hypothetical protein [Bradyrhizobium elkanii]
MLSFAKRIVSANVLFGGAGGHQRFLRVSGLMLAFVP